MTVPVTAQRHTVAALGFANPLNLPANAEAASHVLVYGDVTLLTQGVDYTLDGVGDTGDLDEIAGVDVNIEAAVLAEGLYDSFTVVHSPPLDQQEGLSSGGVLGRIYETALDAIMRRVQALGDTVTRSLHLSVDSDGVSSALPSPEPGLALKWNTLGTALINSLADPDSNELTAASGFADIAEAAADDAEVAQAASETAASTATAQAGAAATSAAAAAQSALDAAAAAGDTEAVLAALEAAKLPVGASVMMNTAAAPTGTLKENGAAVSRTTYSELFAAIGETFGVGDGTTTFNLPESRGEFFRGLDDGRGVDTGRAIASAQTEMVGSHNHTASMSSAGTHAHSYTVGENDAWGGYSRMGSSAAHTAGTGNAGAHTHTITVNASSGTENRPRNKAKLMCIKY